MRPLIFCAMFMISGAARAAPAAGDAARLEWFREARFGMFVHWGVHLCAAGIWNGQPIPSSGDWIQ